jgi:hypothetical protein
MKIIYLLVIFSTLVMAGCKKKENEVMSEKIIGSIDFKYERYISYSQSIPTENNTFRAPVTIKVRSKVTEANNTVYSNNDIYVWKINDSIVSGATSESPQFLFDKAGTYKIYCSVNHEGRTYEKENYVTVTPRVMRIEISKIKIVKVPIYNSVGDFYIKINRNFGYSAQGYIYNGVNSSIPNVTDPVFPISFSFNPALNLSADTVRGIEVHDKNLTAGFTADLTLESGHYNNYAQIAYPDSVQITSSWNTGSTPPTEDVWVFLKYIE